VNGGGGGLFSVSKKKRDLSAPSEEKESFGFGRRKKEEGAFRSGRRRGGGGNLLFDQVPRALGSLLSGSPRGKKEKKFQSVDARQKKGEGFSSSGEKERGKEISFLY